MHAHSPASDPTLGTEDEGPLPALALADSLARTALECLRQHERWARLVDHGVPRAERRFGMKMVETSDDALRTAVHTFETHCDRTALSDDIRRKADGLWMTAREFLRRQQMSNDDSKEFSQHSADHLAVLRTAYELEASALLALRQATREFAKLRGDEV
jgi:hypothetical protein